MEKAFIIFNGIQYPFPVVEATISWARQRKATLVALFVRAKDAPAEGYLFPSDLDAAENVNTRADASASHEAVLGSNISMLQNEAKRQEVSLEVRTLTEPSDDDMADALSGASMIFATDDLERRGILSVDSVDWARILHKNPSQVLHN
ncbi:MAG: hypothetical protein DI535_21325 [Citrobacter freundii]|nr:MAG: hypothetical protein DI535_21325 [Citrobacter freundii]